MSRFVTRISWTILVVLVLIAASLWIAPAARDAGHLRLVRALGVGFIFEFLALIGMLVLLRRKLADQSAHADTQHELLVSQNERLREQNQELEWQAQALQDQTMELETQAVELQAHSEELERANKALEEGERQQHELADRLKYLNRRLNEAQQVAHLGYWEIDSATGLVFWSDEMYRLSGIEPGAEPPPTDRFMDVVHPDDQPRMRAVAARALEELAEFSEQYRIVSPNGLRTVQANGRVLVDDGGVRKLVGTVQDITDRVQLESQLRQAQKMEAVGQLAGGIAHDFNNMLTVVEGYTGLLLSESNLDAPGQQFVEEIRAAARRAAALTRQLLAFSRQEVRQPRVLDLNEAIAGVGKMLGRLIGENIEVHTRLSATPAMVFVDPGQVEQVLVNLVVNARDAMPNGGQLSIETDHVVLDGTYAQRRPIKRAGPYVMLAVSDTGSGIPADVLDRIFEPFFTTKPAGKGTGLGLSTVHGIVEQSDGHVWVYSEMGHGTTFKIYFPLSSAENSVVGHDAGAAGSNAGTETIVLVEDDAALRGVAARVLRRAGYTVIEVANASDALRVCAGPEKLDLLITDLMMPGMSGTELRECVATARPGLPMLLMSGYTRDAMLYAGDALAGDAFIEKPFTPEALARKVRDLLDRAGPSAP